MGNFRQFSFPWFSILIHDNSFAKQLSGFEKGQIHRKLKSHKLSNKTELYDILNDCWQQLSHDLCQSLVECMTRHCQAVIDANGYPIALTCHKLHQLSW